MSGFKMMFPIFPLYPIMSVKVENKMHKIISEFHVSFNLVVEMV